jgi:hypothetical protein
MHSEREIKIGDIIVAEVNFSPFIMKGTKLRISEIILSNGTKNKYGDIIDRTYICRWGQNHIKIKIKLCDYVIEPSGQDNASICTILNQGWIHMPKLNKLWFDTTDSH